MLAGLEVKEAARWSAMPRFSFVAGYLWSWMEYQIMAAMILVPLGQLAGQRLLIDLAKQIPGVMSDGLACADEDIGAATPGLAIASCRHELQYTRLFRS